MYAVDQGDNLAVRNLLSIKADPSVASASSTESSSRKWTPLVVAAWQGATEIVQSILEYDHRDHALYSTDVDTVCRRIRESYSDYSGGVDDYRDAFLGRAKESRNSSFEGVS